MLERVLRDILNLIQKKDAELKQRNMQDNTEGNRKKN